MPIPRNAPSPGSICLLAEGWVLPTQPCSRSGLQKHTALVCSFRPDLATLHSCPGPRPQPGTLWKPPPCQGQGAKPDTEAAAEPAPTPSLCKFTQNVGLYSLKVKHPPSKRKTCWYVNYDKHCWSGNWTCELTLHFKGTYIDILVHSFDLRY